jgi:hypothetical protein
MVCHPYWLGMGVDSSGAAGLHFVIIVVPWSVSVTWQVYARSRDAYLAGALLHKPPGTSCTSVGWSSPHYTLQAGARSSGGQWLGVGHGSCTVINLKIRMKLIS